MRAKIAMHLKRTNWQFWPAQQETRAFGHTGNGSLRKIEQWVVTRGSRGRPRMTREEHCLVQVWDWLGDCNMQQNQRADSTSRSSWALGCSLHSSASTARTIFTGTSGSDSIADWISGVELESTIILCIPLDRGG